MKKILLLSAFALFGSFAMANDITKNDKTEEFKTETFVKFFGCTVSVRTILLDPCGNVISDTTEVYESDDKNCEGLVMNMKKETRQVPCKPVSVVGEGEQ